MRRIHTCILVMALVLGLAGQSTAAPSGFKEYKLDGLSIALPASWVVASKDLLGKLQETAKKGVTLLLAAHGDAAGFPKFTVMRQAEETLSQDDFEKMDAAGIDDMCRQLKAQMTSAQAGADFSCKRVKTEKGMALATQFTVAEAGVVTLSYLFFQGPKEFTQTTAIFMKADEAKLLPVAERAMNTVRLEK